LFIQNSLQQIIDMKFLSLEPFVPSGSDFEKSKQLFLDLGFKISWDAGDYLGFDGNGCKFILQKFDNRQFAENFMLSVKVDDIVEFQSLLLAKDLVKRYGISVSPITKQPYGMEINIIDIAGVCWHFVE
jgi:hypothetical protein